MTKIIKTESTIRCLKCGYKEKLKMPLYASKHSYECPSCKEVHKVLAGSCCIFCSYGSSPCIPSQHKSQRTSLVDRLILQASEISSFSDQN